jgi:hypothetical protein
VEVASFQGWERGRWDRNRTCNLRFWRPNPACRVVSDAIATCRSAPLSLSSCAADCRRVSAVTGAHTGAASADDDAAIADRAATDAVPTAAHGYEQLVGTSALDSSDDIDSISTADDSRRVLLTLPTPEGGGFSGYAQPTGSRWHLTGLPSPRRTDAWSEEQALTQAVPPEYSTLVQEGAIPMPKDGACAPKDVGQSCRSRPYERCHSDGHSDRSVRHAGGL